MQYKDGITYCLVYNTAQMPKQCQDGSWTRIKDSCLSAYKHTAGMYHLLWAKKRGYLDKLRIINHINNMQYESLHFAIQTFVLPYLKHLPNTLAASDTWLKDWEVVDYFNNIPDELKPTLLEQVQNICRGVYKPSIIPEKVQTKLQKVEKPIAVWLKQLKSLMWS